MSWLKHVIVDLAVLGVIAAYAFGGYTWAFWIIAVYTGFLLVLKIGALTTGVAQAVKARGGGEPPVWFFHVVYAANVVLLLAATWYSVAALWAVIWILSAIAEARNRPTRSRDAA